MLKKFYKIYKKRVNLKEKKNARIEYAILKPNNLLNIAIKAVINNLFSNSIPNDQINNHSRFK